MTFVNKMEKKNGKGGRGKRTNKGSRIENRGSPRPLGVMVCCIARDGRHDEAGVSPRGAPAVGSLVPPRRPPRSSGEEKDASSVVVRAPLSPLTSLYLRPPTSCQRLPSQALVHTTSFASRPADPLPTDPALTRPPGESSTQQPPYQPPGFGCVRPAVARRAPALNSLLALLPSTSFSSRGHGLKIDVHPLACLLVDSPA